MPLLFRYLRPLWQAVFTPQDREQPEDATHKLLELQEGVFKINAFKISSGTLGPGDSG